MHNIILNNVDILIYFGILGFFGITLKFVLYFTGQYWASTVQHSYTFVLLPIIGFVIVTASGSALSPFIYTLF